MSQEYKIAIEEMVVQQFIVIATNSQQAMQIAIEKYKNGEFVLEHGCLVAKQMAIVKPNQDTTEWIEF